MCARLSSVGATGIAVALGSPCDPLDLHKNDSRVFSVRQNAPTWTPSGVRAVADGVSLQHAYALAERVTAHAQPTVRGHRIVWVRGGCYGVRELSAHDAAYAIVGRHTHADVVLELDPTIALRHLVLRSIETGGQLALRILDLQTSTGFALADGEPRRSAVVRGPVAFQVGDYTLVALPTDPAPRALPPAFLEAMSSPYRAPSPRPLGTSHIGIVPGISDLGKLCMYVEGDARSAFSLERAGGARETVLVSELEQQRGIVVGRSPKAHEHLLALMDANVSRMHMLLVREHAETFAIDLCSMNGTWIGRERVRRVRLSPGMQLRLGDSGQLAFTWHGRA